MLPTRKILLPINTSTKARNSGVALMHPPRKQRDTALFVTNTLGQGVDGDHCASHDREDKRDVLQLLGDSGKDSRYSLEFCFVKISIYVNFGSHLTKF